MNSYWGVYVSDVGYDVKEFVVNNGELFKIKNGCDQQLYQIVDGCIVDTFYDLDSNQQEAMESKMNDMYCSQSEHLFIYGEQTPEHEYQRDAEEALFGIIKYPNALFDTKAKANKFIKTHLREFLENKLASVQRTIAVIREDNGKVLDSFKKIEKDPTPTVSSIDVGDKVYKFVKLWGIFEYTIDDVFALNFGNIEHVVYALTCISCTHGNPCKVFATKQFDSTLIYTANADDSIDSHNTMLHADNTYPFTTSRKRAYEMYKNNILDANSTNLTRLSQEEKTLLKTLSAK